LIPQPNNMIQPPFVMPSDQLPYNFHPKVRGTLLVLHHEHFTPMQNNLLFSFFHMFMSMLRSMSCHNAVNFGMHYRVMNEVMVCFRTLCSLEELEQQFYIINSPQIIPPTFFCFGKHYPIKALGHLHV